MSTLPFASVIMPVFNEERFIEHSLGTVLAQDYPPDRMEIIVADGMSTDRTRERLQAIQLQHAKVRLIDNPGRIIATGLNRAIDAARGEIIVRMDAHNEYPPSYLRQVVKLREQTGAENAGGVLIPVGNGSYISEAIAAAYQSPLATGSALRAGHTSAVVREVDTVYGGCWRKEQLMALGRFDESMVRNQDDELSFRLRKAGGTIVQSSAIRTSYSVRHSYRRLFLQFAQYGYWKVRVIQKHPRQASLRHFLPATFVLTVMGLALLAPFSKWAALAGAGLGAIYGTMIAGEALRWAIRSGFHLWPGIGWSLILMQAGYGGGFLVGWLRQGLGPLPTDKLFERVTR